jgi:hypothetical protein
MLVRLRHGCTEQGKGLFIITGITELTIDRCTANFASGESRTRGPVSCTGCCGTDGGADRSRDGRLGWPAGNCSREGCPGWFGRGGRLGSWGGRRSISSSKEWV